MTPRDDLFQEREKWDKYFSTISDIQESEYLRNFGIEFSEKILSLLPDGGTVLEMGCGAGWQSLVLSRTGKFDVTLLDMSENAIDLARSIFKRENLRAEFVLADAFQYEEGKYDLVFNAGVLEHYNPDVQTVYLQKMAMRSNKFVLALAPNRLCEWYWFWRIQSTINMDWPFGKEVPIVDLSQLFLDAGLHFIGLSYMGEGWTESFINHLDGTDEGFREIAISIHRSQLLSVAQKAYLVAFLGSVPKIDPVPMGWEEPKVFDLPGTGEMLESIAISLSQNIQEKRDHNQLMIEKQQTVEQLHEEISRLEKEKIQSIDLLQGIISREKEQHDQELSQIQANLELLNEQLKLNEIELIQNQESHQQAIDALIFDQENEIHRLDEFYKQKIETLLTDQLNETHRLEESHQVELDSHQILMNEEISSLKGEHNQLLGRLGEKERSIETLTGELKEVYGSNAWKFVRRIWTLEVWLRSYRLLAMMETKFRGAVSRRGKTAQKRGLLASPSPVPDSLLPTRSQIFEVNPKEETGAEIPSRYLLSPSSTRIILLTPTFFDWNGNNMFCGGAERYLIELCRIFRELGYDPVIVQCGNFDWMRFFYDIQVVGIQVTGAPENLTSAIERLNPIAELFIYSPFYLASEKLKSPSIGISHGVYWDDSSFQSFPGSLKKTISDIIQNFEKVTHIVSVDTNTINWLRATQSELSSKTTYLVNFVDHSQFKPVTRDSTRLVILFPRRLYKPRGFWLLAEILPDILSEFPQVDFYLVGKATGVEEVQVQEWIQHYPGRLRHEVFEPDQMHLAYQQADITLIPTIHSEGTSLSCLEAMSSGNAVIATNVGGLPDLILNEFNGLMIEPEKIALKEAIDRLIKDPELRHELGKNARKTVERSFTLDLWRKRWISVLKQYLPFRPAKSITAPQTLVFPFTGIAWEGIKQRPHHIASMVAQKGYEIFWIDPSGRRTPAPNVHLLNPDDTLYLSEPLLLIYYPYNFEEISKFKQPTVIHDILDDISIFDHVTWDEPGKSARDYFQRLLERADITITSSQVLLDKIKPSRQDVLFVPNGIDTNHFDPQKFDVAREIKDFSRPIIGFHGAIADWVDVNLVAEVAKLRPNYQFVFVGPVSIPEEISGLIELKNVHMLDSVRYENIPAYIKGFDVGILPFELKPLTHAVRPLKVLEYLAMGKPVVATPIEEIRNWPGVWFAETASKFTEQLDSILQAGTNLENSAEIREFLEKSTWQAVMAPLMQKLQL